MEFQLFGDVELHIGDRSLDVGTPRQQTVLAALVVDAGRTVAMDTLIDRVWDDAPPAEARNAMYSHLSRIRRLLRDASDLTGDANARLERRHAGYLLTIHSRDVDVHRFQMLAEEGRDPTTDGTARVASLAEALQLWRGTPLAGLSGVWAEQVRSNLHRRRLDVIVRWAEGKLQLGESATVIIALHELVNEYPLVESLEVVLMRALHAAGRASEAIHRYTTVRRRLAEELGVDPGAELSMLHQEILRGELVQPIAVEELGLEQSAALRKTDQRLVPNRVEPVASHPKIVEPFRGRVPRQLPPGAALFVGRHVQLDQLDALLHRDDFPYGGELALITGPAGVGKTALAIQWAYQRRDRFSDGQLYANMLGYATGRPLPPAVALTRFLRALGVAAEELPGDEVEATALYRSLVAEQRMVVVLDNVLNAEQVRPLLPAGGSVAVVTSRVALGTLVAHEGAHHVPVDVLTPDEARMLLIRTVGTERAAKDLDSVDAIASLCGNLSLALRIVAANLVLRPRLRMADQVTRLRGGDRLGELVVAEDPQSAVRVSFDLSYRRLSMQAQRVFRLIGLVPGLDVDVTTIAAMVGSGHDEAAGSLGELVRAHLLDEGAAERYTLHDLLRCYARGLSRQVEHVSEGEAALDRLFRHYRDISGAETSATWLDLEEANLVAAVNSASSPLRCGLAREIVDNLRGYFWARMYTIGTSGVLAPGGGSDMRAQATVHLDLASLRWREGDYDAATRNGLAALDFARAAGWLEGQAAISGHLGITCLRMGNLDHGVAHLCESLELYQHTAWRPARATVDRHSSRVPRPGAPVGRNQELRRLTSVLTSSDSRRFATIQGPAGSGRTTLALAAGHAASGHYPGGMQYLDFLGHSTNGPRLPAEVMEDLLLRLGTEAGSIPSGLEQRIARCRSRLVERPALVIVDNAPNRDMWESLLPESSSGGLIVVVADCTQGAASTVTLRQLTGTTSAPNAIPDAYHALCSDAARMIRLLATHPAATVGAGAAEALSGLSPSATKRVVDELVGVQLLERDSDERVRMCSTVRAYATGRCELEDDAAERELAVDRVLEWYLRLVYAANHVLAPYRQNPGLDRPRHNTQIPDLDYDEALRWCDSELPNVVVAAQLALDSAENVTAWKLAVGSFDYLFHSRRTSLWRELHELGLAGARRAGDRHGQAWVLQNLAMAHTLSGDRESARSCFREALAIRQGLGDRIGEAWTLTGSGWLDLEEGDFATAAAKSNRAAMIFLECAEPVGEGVALTRVSNAYRGMGDSDRALEAIRKALEILVTRDENHGEGLTILLLAETYRELGRIDDAVLLFQRAMKKHRKASEDPSNRM